MQNFRNLGQPLLGEKLPKRRERERREKNANNTGHIVQCSARKPLGPIVEGQRNIAWCL